MPPRTGTTKTGTTKAPSKAAARTGSARASKSAAAAGNGGGTKLVIVESPSKAKTLKKYLGKDYEILASYGHVRDLVPKTGAVDPLPETVKNAGSSVTATATTTPPQTSAPIVIGARAYM